MGNGKRRKQSGPNEPGSTSAPERENEIEISLDAGGTGSAETSAGAPPTGQRTGVLVSPADPGQNASDESAVGSEVEAKTLRAKVQTAAPVGDGEHPQANGLGRASEAPPLPIALPLSVPLHPELDLEVANGLFVRLTRDGYCADKVLEGAFGVVVPVYTTKYAEDRNAAPTYAMKLPRLMADTHRENMAIADKLQAEEDQVRRLPRYFKANQKDDPGHQGTLLQAHMAEPFRAVHFLEARLRSLLAVRFDSRRGPCFARVYFRDGQNGEADGTARLVPIAQAGIPENAPPPLDASEERLRSLLAAAQIGSSQRTAIATLTEVRDNDDKTLDERAANGTVALAAFRDDTPFGRVWYTGLPCVLYQWATSTLQEQSSSGRLGQWDVRRQLKLAQRVLVGLNYLHSAKTIHGDIRLANIMHDGDREKFEPEHCFLIDYGSFADDFPVADVVPCGYTIGPLVSGGRASLFYAPERRSLVAREDADTAFIFLSDKPEDADKHVYVRLDWRTHIEPILASDGKNGLVSSTLAHAGDALLAEGPQDEFGKGDYLRLRDFAARVVWRQQVNPEKGESFELICCERTMMCRVLHDKVMVKLFRDKPAAGHHTSELWQQLKSGVLLSIPQVLELRRWTAATDLYSVGVLVLYSLFMMHDAEARPPTRRERDTLHQQFRALLETLENESFFVTMWPEMASLWSSLDNGFAAARKRGAGPESIAGDIYTYSDGQKTAPLSTAISSFMSHLASNVPYLARIITNIGCDAAASLMVTHFALCCIHRRTVAGKGTGSAAADAFSALFCASRQEEARPKGAAQHALARLAVLGERVDLLLDTETFKMKTVPAYDANSEYNQSRELARLRELVKPLGEECLGEFGRRRAELQRQEKSLLEREEEFKRAAQPIEAAAERLLKSINSAESASKEASETAASARTAAEQATSEAMRARTEAGEAKKVSQDTQDLVKAINQRIANPPDGHRWNKR